MSQHDFNIANQSASNSRSDINNALKALATLSSGSTPPSNTYANQWWYDTSNNILKIRSEADDAWINVGYLDQSTNEFKPYIGATQITAFLDEDDMSSDSATAIPSQQSVKAYVDTEISNIDVVPANTLLGTITLSSSGGSLTGLDLTAYKQLLFKADFSGTGASADMRIEGVIVSDVEGSFPYDGFFIATFYLGTDLMLAHGAHVSNSGAFTGIGLTTASTSISVTGNGNFDSGTVEVWGI